MASAADLTLDELRLELAPEIALAAIFDGWSDAAVVSASKVAGVDPAVARLAFPDGAMDMIAAWVASVDARMEAAFDGGVLAQMPVRERIRALVWFRLEAVAGLEEALRRALAIQAMPQNLARTAKLGWASADVMWRLAGDTATDYNHYSKRAILAGILSSAMAIRMTQGRKVALDFVDRRIEEVMRFEKWKATTRLRPGQWLAGAAEALGRARPG